MKITFTTNMADKVGSFVKASKILSALGLNITRVSYNKAVDTHTLFIEVDGDEEVLKLAQLQLEQNGFLENENLGGKVVLIEFKLEDKPGILVPVLELIEQFNFNISYISSQANDKPYQNFRMGLFVDSPQKLSDFLNKASPLCKLKIIDYDSTEKVLDNTVFYLNFANNIAEKLNLDKTQKNNLVVNSNLIMEMLASTTRKTQKTFDYISRFADYMCQFKNEKFKPRITCPRNNGNYEIIVIEPPCGSNAIVFYSEKGIVVFDGGFSCYSKEMINTIKSLLPDFDEKEKVLLLTHADVDHTGLCEYFDKIYCSELTKEVFEREDKNLTVFRESDPKQAPYVKISKILSNYKKVDVNKLIAFESQNSATFDQPINKICNFKIFDYDFSIYLGKGGHTEGETVYVEENSKVMLTGDIYFNLYDLISEQKAFNRIAPYLMTSVDCDKEKAREEREFLLKMMNNDKYLIIGSHGAVKTEN